MKKNAMLKIAAILVVAVLLTTCAISATFAKYVTTGGSQEFSARVAKWGLEFATGTDDVFAAEYKSGSNVVVLSGEANVDVLAPGTQNDGGIAVTITGAPEVALQMKAIVNVTFDGAWVNQADAVYCPIVFDVGGQEVKIAAAATNLTTFENDLEKAIAKALVNSTGEATAVTEGGVEVGYSATKDYYPASGTVNTDFADIDLTVGWEWPYEASGKDAADTALGNAAAAGTNVPTITIEYSLYAEQIGADFATPPTT